MKLRVYFDVEHIEQIVACVQFAESLGVTLGMSPLGGSKQDLVSLGDSEPDDKHDKALFMKAKEILKTPVRRIELVRLLAKEVKKNPKSIGSTVVSWIRAGYLKC